MGADVMRGVLSHQGAEVSTFGDLEQPPSPAAVGDTPKASTHEEVVQDTRDLSLDVFELEGVRIDLTGLSVSMKCEIVEGRYETAETSICRKLIEPGESILELGGGIGFVGIVCRRELSATRVVSLEPNPGTLDRLRRNYALNTLEPTVIEAAVAAEDGVANLNVSSEFWFDSLIRADASTEPWAVRTVSFSSLLGETGTEFTALIVDIEGAETLLPWETLPSGIRKIIVEIHPDICGLGAAYRVLHRLMLNGFEVVQTCYYVFGLVRSANTQSSEPSSPQPPKPPAATATHSYQENHGMRCPAVNMPWSEIAKVEGFFSEANYRVWQTFFDFQARHNITGNLFEIGVWKGRSAAALSLHRKPGEILILVDSLIEHFRVIEDLRSKGFNMTGVVAIAKKSEAFGRIEMVEAEKSVRWFHIDGDHSAEVVYSDIALADRFISPAGIIVLDDFFNARYVSVAWAAFDYLRNHPHSLRMILAGDNKAYLCRPSQLAMYREFLLEELPARLIGTGLALQQSTLLFDCETLGLCGAWNGADQTFIGLDSDSELRAHERVTYRLR